MALACISGARECTACRRCFSASVCNICGMKIPDNKKYYMLFDSIVCESCVQNSIAEEATVCSLCSEYVNEGEKILIFENEIICSVCAKLSKARKGYI